MLFDLPESLQHTKETVPDQLSKITDATGKTYIIHIEWQSEDDATMDNRNARLPGYAAAQISASGTAICHLSGQAPINHALCY